MNDLPIIFPPVPAETAKVVHAIFAGNNFYLRIGDQVESLYFGLNLEASSEQAHKTAQGLARLYLILVFQLLESLSDRLAREAIRQRIDWKYALHLPMDDSGVGELSLCEFRNWLLIDRSGSLTLQALLDRLTKLVGETDKEGLSLDTKNIVRKVCLINRIDRVRFAIRQVLKILAHQNCEKLNLVSLPNWFDRYSDSRGNQKNLLAGLAQGKLVQALGADGTVLLNAISASGDPCLVENPEFQALQKVLNEQYEYVEGHPRWRGGPCLDCPTFTRQESPGLSNRGEVIEEVQ